MRDAVIPRDEPDPRTKEPGLKFHTALACYAAIALLAGFTLDGNFRLVVWIFLAGLVVRTWIATLKKP